MNMDDLIKWWYDKLTTVFSGKVPLNFDGAKLYNFLSIVLPQCGLTITDLVTIDRNAFSEKWTKFCKEVTAKKRGDSVSNK